MSLKFLDFSFRIQPKYAKRIIKNNINGEAKNKTQQMTTLKSLSYNTFGNIHTAQPSLYNFGVQNERKFFSGFVKDKRRAELLLRGFNINLYEDVLKDLRHVKLCSKLFYEHDNLTIKMPTISSSFSLDVKSSKKAVHTDKLSLSLQGMKILKTHLLQVIYKQNVFDNSMSLQELELKYRFNMTQDVVRMINSKLQDFRFHITIFDLKKEDIESAYSNEKNLQTILALFGFIGCQMDSKALANVILRTFEKDFITANSNFLSSY